jgi:perosamine synthetase
MNQDDKIVKNGCWSIIVYFKNTKLKTIKKIKKKLINSNFFSRPFFYPITYLPAYRKIDKNYRKFKNFNSIAYSTYKKGIVMPSSFILKKTKVKQIANIIIKELNNEK